ncbi:MAG: hypothetical protein JSV63_03035 [Candidatus Aenigmatarchaeota archaeon]|nr:MAG: hypothetical protein JSV63_03035 [Candidatus Aenigmarchaeota archaeon]
MEGWIKGLLKLNVTAAGFAIGIFLMNSILIPQQGYVSDKIQKFIAFFGVSAILLLPLVFLLIILINKDVKHMLIGLLLSVMLIYNVWLISLSFYPDWNIVFNVNTVTFLALVWPSCVLLVGVVYLLPRKILKRLKKQEPPGQAETQD